MGIDYGGISCHIPTYAGSLKRNQWQDSGVLGLGRTLRGLKLGIAGTYRKNRALHRAIRQSVWNEVMVGVARTRGDQAQADGFEAAATKQTFFESVDVLSLHLRLNSVTKGCVTASDLSVMET
ncbi:hypothetical protein OH492_26460 [Vibrio chagasii]|nr:hypothetical protein [Vibrio chagasii]